MDMNALLTLLSVREKLVGHPDLSDASTVVNNEIDKLKAASKTEAAKIVADKVAAVAKAGVDQATVDQENAILTQAAAARARVDQVGLDTQQAAADKAIIAQADAIAKAREARAPKAVPASTLTGNPGSMAHFPLGHVAPTPTPTPVGTSNV